MKSTAFGIFVAVGLLMFVLGAAQAQPLGTSISSTGALPNANAMLDVQSPAAGDGKGLLIPRITASQRTTASAVLAGGLLDGGGDLRGGAAQGLLVYQTDGTQGFYYNTSASATPAWAYLGSGSGDFKADGSVAMTGNLNAGGQALTNVSQMAMSVAEVMVGQGAVASSGGGGIAIGQNANGVDPNSLGHGGVAIGQAANAYNAGVAVGGNSTGSVSGVAVGYNAIANSSGSALGNAANGFNDGVAVGHGTKGYNMGAAVGWSANGVYYGSAVGWSANGHDVGAALGSSAEGSSYGVAVGYSANGSQTNVAIGTFANAQGGTERLAIGHNVTNHVDNSAAMRGNLYLDGATNVMVRSTFGTGAWTPITVSAGDFKADGTVPMNGNLNAGGQALTNVSLIAFSGTNTAVGLGAIGGEGGAALGYQANGNQEGVAVGYQANGGGYGAAVGKGANSYVIGAAVGRNANGSERGVAMGWDATGRVYGVALGMTANGSNWGTALGTGANGSQTNVAIGVNANAQGGTERMAIGHAVVNTNDNSAVIRGTLYMDGTGAADANIKWRQNFGTGGWSTKTFTIDHPLDPENKVLRHYCVEGPEVWNVYAGNAQLVNGRAEVELPDYYAALNKVGSEVVSLTPWGNVRVWIAGMEDNRLTLAGDGDAKISWTIKVLRNDPGCLEDLKRRPVEQLKSEMLPGQAAAENQVVNTYPVAQ